MKHVPHLVIAAPWEGESLEINIVQWRHLTKVLRKHRGDEVTYTDGLGTVGTGRLTNQALERGEETFVERGPLLTVAVAPPSSKDRQRYVVEKLAELGVARLMWLETSHGKNRVASPTKVFNWILAAVEQSRGAWLMEASNDLTSIGDLEGDIVFCDQEGNGRPDSADVVVVGPEGGWAEGELPALGSRWSLGNNVLRVETAAVVAAARILEI